MFGGQQRWWRIKKMMSVSGREGSGDDGDGDDVRG